MDELPLEIKQRICSNLSPKHLKPLRLACKSFSKAAEPYLINRFTLTNRPESITALRNITDHASFNKYISTIIYDPSILADYPDLKDWLSTKSAAKLGLPCWEDYAPRSLTLDGKESYAAMTLRVMKEARTNYLEALEAAKARNAASWRLHQELAQYQVSSAHYRNLRQTLVRAFTKCYRLRNLVISTIITTVPECSLFNDIVQTSMSWSDSLSYLPWLGFWEILPMLRSLSLIDVYRHALPKPSLYSCAKNLRHLRVSHSGSSTSCYGHLEPSTIAGIVCGAKSLETMKLSNIAGDMTAVVNMIRSSRLRVCLMSFDEVTEDALVEFILFHSASLQRLGLVYDTILSGSRDSLVRRISGQLSKLRKEVDEAIEEVSVGLWQDYESMGDWR